MMIVRFLSLLLLFTALPKLASAQWGPDQFLFPQEPQTARPKTVKKEKKRPQVPLPIAPVEVPQSEPPPQENEFPPRTPAAVDLSKVSLRAQLGYIDFSSASQRKGLDFEQGAFSVGARVSFHKDERNSFRFEYTTTAELQSALEWQGQSVNRIKWEDTRIEYSYKVSREGVDIYFGPIVRENAWWGEVERRRSSLQEIYSLGLHGGFQLLRKDRWRHQARTTILPWLREEQENTQGLVAFADWTAAYEIRAQRELILNLGWEHVQISGRGSMPPSLDQRMIKVFLGYRLTSF